MKRYFAIAGLVGAGALSGVGLAACGGDDTPETPIVVTDQTQQLTKDEFISQADAICAEANTAIADIAAAGEGITRAADVADLRQGVVTDIRDLGKPIDDGSTSGTDTSAGAGTDTTATSDVEDASTFPGEETDTSAEGIGSGTGTDTTGTADTGTAAAGDDLERFLQAMQTQVKAGQKIDLASQRGESTAEPEAELEAAKEEAADAAAAYGFQECGTEGTPSGDSTAEDSTSGTSVAPSSPSAPAPSAPAPSPDTGGGVSPGGGVAPE